MRTMRKVGIKAFEALLNEIDLSLRDLRSLHIEDIDVSKRIIINDDLTRAIIELGDIRIKILNN